MGAEGNIIMRNRPEMDMMDIYDVGYVFDLVYERFNIKPLRRKIEKDRNRVAYKPHASQYYDAADQNARNGVSIHPSCKVYNNTRDDHPYGRKGISEDMEPDAFDVEVFMVVAQDKNHEKVTSKAQDSYAQHNGDTDVMWRQKPFICFMENEDGNNKEAQAIDKRGKDTDPLITESGISVRWSFADVCCNKSQGYCQGIGNHMPGIA